MNILENYNYMLSSQTLTAPYGFGGESVWTDAAIALRKMGTNHLKFCVFTLDDVKLRLDHVFFPYVLLWYRNGAPWSSGGFSDADKKTEYDEMYRFTRDLLTEYNESGITFYLGHWEGDWIYLGGNPAIEKMDERLTQGMIEWYQIRQKAVDDAKRDTVHENVEIWHYLEMNRPVDAIDLGYDRLINRVLPYVDVDFVSYSAYDCQSLSAQKVKEVIAAIEAAMKPKEGIEGSRVFIGEYGYQGELADGIPEKHREMNLAAMAKYLAAGVKFILYWEAIDVTFDPEKGQVGHGMIARDGSLTLYGEAMVDLLEKGKAYVASYYETNGTVPSEQEYREFLLSTDWLKTFA